MFVYSVTIPVVIANIPPTKLEMPICTSIPVVLSPSLKLLMNNHILPNVVSVSEEWEGDEVDELSLRKAVDWIEHDISVVGMIVETDDCRLVR